MLSIPRCLKFGLIVPMVLIVAFLLNVPVEWMVRRGARRSRARILVFLLALVIAVAIGLTLVPLVLGQARQLLTHLPVWINSGQHQLAVLHQQLRASHLPLNLEALEFQTGDQLKEELKLLANPLVGFAALTVSTLLDLLLTVIMTFYLIQYGDRIWAGLMGWLPLELREPFSRSLRRSFHRFFLGQLILSLCLSGALILVFAILQVPFGFLFGLTIGTMALVPLGGTVGIAVVTVLVTLQQAALGIKVLIAAFVVQQLLENGVAPRLMGHVTGLNPVWVLIAILTGARVGSLLGVVVAVPMAVVINTFLTVQQARLYPPPTLPGQDP